MLVGGVIYHIALLFKRLKKTARVVVEEYAMVPFNELAAAAEVTYSIVERPTPESPPTPPQISDSNSDSVSLENKNSQNEGTPCEDHATYSPDIGGEDTVPLLKSHL